MPVSNPLNVKYDKGSGNLDRRHMLQRQLRLQAARSSPRPVDWSQSLLGGWEIAGTFIDETGVPGNGHSTTSVPDVDQLRPVGLGGGGYTDRPNLAAK